MSEKSGFFMSHNGDRRYTPDWLASWVEALVTTGIYANTMAVSAAGGMAINVATGRAWVKGYLYENTTAKAMAIATAHATLHRKDAIVVRLDLTNRQVSVEVLTGTPANAPVAPAIVRDANIYDLKLAEVYVAAGTTAITQAMITDTRLNTAVCGLTVCTVQEIPTDTFLAQMTDEFYTWYETIQGILDENVAAHLMNMITALQETVGDNYTELSTAIEEMGQTINQDMAISQRTKTALGLGANAKLDDALYAAGKHIILDITFVSTFANKSYTITGAGLTEAVTGTVPSGKNIKVPVLATNCDYTLTCNGQTFTLHVGEYFGIYRFMAAPPLSSATPAIIGEVAASGLAPLVWSIGDEVSITLTGNEVITMQIYDFAHDTLQAGGLAPITFGMKNLMAATQKMNGSNTNVGGWPGSAMYTTLNTTIYGKLPAAWKNIIKQVVKLTSTGNQQRTLQSSNDKLFLFCEEEVFGGNTNGVPGEGRQYPIFTDAASRIKKLSNGTGSAYLWWLRSPRASNATSFCYVNSDGTPNGYNASTAYGVAFGFCV